MKISKRKNRAFSRFGRGVFGYRYIKRNLLAAAAIVATVAGIGLVVKYGEALDHKASVPDSQQTQMVQATAEEMSTEATTAEEATTEAEAQKSAQTASMVTASEQSATSESKIAVKESTVNVREEASTDAAIVGKLTDGCVGDILETDGDWLKISSGDVTGYVAAEYVLSGEEAALYAEEHKNVTGTVTEETVRVRAEKSTDAEILELAAKDDIFTVTEQDDDWVQVALDGDTTGYIAAAYITVVEVYDYAMTIDDYNAMIEAENEKALALAAQENAAQMMSTDDTSEETEQKATTEKSKKTTKQTEKTTEATTEKSSETSSSGSYSDSYLLACLVSMEAGSESYDGQLAVANVVLNRVKSGSWGDSISDVIYAKGQFPSVTGNVMQRYLEDGPLASAQKAANAALAGENNIGSYKSFLNVKYVDTDSLADYEIIGNHCFY